jgi:hypothetical protein
LVCVRGGGRSRCERRATKRECVYREPFLIAAAAVP